MNKRRVFFGFFMLIFFCRALFCYDGVMAGQNNIKIARTEYFDIIYAPGSEKSAEVLYENADGIFTELSNLFGLLHSFRLPVVISPAQDEFNAYYSSAPFSHIVMYDTVPPESFAVFSETLLSTFRHELIHAVTYNLHNNFWTKVKKIGGDTYNPALLTITSGWAEGASVSVESSGGEGRLNSEYHKQLVRQAKIEGKFPRFSEVQGARDVYPSGQLSYYFGGAFSAFLQQKYGMEKYARFWYKCVNFQTLTYFGCFKKVYGFPIQDAWEEFYDSVEVPDVSCDPAEEDWCAALTAGGKNGNLKNVSLVCASEEGAAFYDADSASVKYACFGRGKTGGSFEEGALSRAKTLCTQDDVSRLNISSGGELLAVSYTSLSGRVPKNKIRIINTKTRRSFTLPESGIRDGTVFLADGKWYLAAVKTHSQYCTLNLYSLTEGKNGSVKKAVLVRQKKFGFGKGVFSPSGSSSGSVFYILKDGMEYTIRAFSALQDETEWIVPLPEKDMVIQTLNVRAGAYGTEHLTFSFTRPGTMPRLALLSADISGRKADFSLSTRDSSGGIFSPSCVSGKKYVYSAHFFESNAIFTADLEKMTFETYSVRISEFAPGLQNAAALSAVSPLPQAVSSGTQADSPFPEFYSASKPFSPAKYAFSGPHGTFVPFALTQSYVIKKSADALEAVLVPFGISYITGTPWTYPLFGFSAGFNPLTESAALLAGIYGGTSETQLLSYYALLQVEFDLDGYKQAYGALNVSSKIALGRRTYLSFLQNAQIFEGRQGLIEIPENSEKFFGALKSDDETHRVLFTDRTSAGLGTIKKSGKGFYDYSGVELSAVYMQNWCACVSEPSYEYDGYQNIGLDFTAKNSALLPLSAEVFLFPSKSYFLGALAECVFLTKEIQKSTVKMPFLYANRFTLSGYYMGKFTHGWRTYMDSWSVLDTADYMRYLCEGDFYYYDEACLSASFMLTPNIGGLSRPAFRFELKAQFFYRQHPDPDQNHYSASICGITVF